MMKARITGPVNFIVREARVLARFVRFAYAVGRASPWSAVRRFQL